MSDRLTTQQLQWVRDYSAPWGPYVGVKTMAEELIRLRRFAGQVMDCHTGSIEGDDIEEIAEAAGIMTCHTVGKRHATGRCGRDCYCVLEGYAEDDACHMPLIDASGDYIEGEAR